jgi:hypothetical protein
MDQREGEIHRKGIGFEEGKPRNLPCLLEFHSILHEDSAGSKREKAYMLGFAF